MSSSKRPIRRELLPAALDVIPLVHVLLKVAEGEVPDEYAHAGRTEVVLGTVLVEVGTRRRWIRVFTDIAVVVDFARFRNGFKRQSGTGALEWCLLCGHDVRAEPGTDRRDQREHNRREPRHSDAQPVHRSHGLPPPQNPNVLNISYTQVSDGTSTNYRNVNNPV
jgi:hypothetical protein